MRLLEKVYYKLKIDIVWNTTASFFAKLFWKPFQIMPALDTVEYIKATRCSVARFGDGELHILAYGCALKFQRADKQLQKRLIEIAEKTESTHNVLLCLPNRLNMLKHTQMKQLPVFWRKSLKVHLYAWTKRFSKNRLYGDTNFSRLTDGNNNEDKVAQVKRIQGIWENRNIILVEGCKTRFGVGNDLLDNAASIRRILGPAESAFDYYEEILSAVQRTAENTHEPLVIMAMGPTATVLAYDLALSGIQAIDLGHLDISYMRILTGNMGAIPGKYTNEADGGNVVDDCDDPEYLEQILCYIGC